MSEDASNDVSAADVKAEFARAEKMLDDARKATDVDISKATVVNRLYYACFHAAQAALYGRGLNPQSHGHGQILLGQELIQPGTVDREFGRFLNDMETYGRRVEHGSGTVERDTQELIDGTVAFLEAMQEAVDRES